MPIQVISGVELYNVISWISPHNVHSLSFTDITLSSSLPLTTLQFFLQRLFIQDFNQSGSPLRLPGQVINRSLIFKQLTSNN